MDWLARALESLAANRPHPHLGAFDVSESDIPERGLFFQALS
jgi:hypothetical protein